MCNHHSTNEDFRQIIFGKIKAWLDCGSAVLLLNSHVLPKQFEQLDKQFQANKTDLHCRKNDKVMQKCAFFCQRRSNEVPLRFSIQNGHGVQPLALDLQDNFTTPCSLERCRAGSIGSTCRNTTLAAVIGTWSS